MEHWKSRNYVEGLEIKIKDLILFFVKLKALAVICLIASFIIGMKFGRADMNGVSFTDTLNSILYQ